MSKKLMSLVVCALAVVTLAGCNKPMTNDTTTTGDVNTGDIVTTTGTTVTTGDTDSDVTPTDTQGTQTRELDTDKSVLGWEGSRVAYSYTGRVFFKNGSLTFVDGVPMSGSFTLDMTNFTLDNGSEAPKKHLMGDDFFAVTTYPEAKLVITSGQLLSGTSYNITADLTIKDKTNPVTFVAVFNADLTTATADFEIDRTKWDIKFGSDNFFQGLGDKAIKDNIGFKTSVVLK